MPTPTTAPRLGARVLLLDQADRVLLLHARDPDDPGHHWWELPGGGVDHGETLADTAIREVKEETGIILDTLSPCVWIRETRFHYRNRAHHRREHVFLARPDTTMPTAHTTPTENEQAGLLGRRWWSHTELSECRDKLLPPALPTLLGEILAGQLAQPATLYQELSGSARQFHRTGSTGHPGVALGSHFAVHPSQRSGAESRIATTVGDWMNAGGTSGDERPEQEHGTADAAGRGGDE